MSIKYININRYSTYVEYSTTENFLNSLNRIFSIDNDKILVFTPVQVKKLLNFPYKDISYIKLILISLGPPIDITEDNNYCVIL
jgi:hypothetical protein